MISFAISIDTGFVLVKENLMNGLGDIVSVFPQALLNEPITAVTATGKHVDDSCINIPTHTGQYTRNLK